MCAASCAPSSFTPASRQSQTSVGASGGSPPSNTNVPVRPPIPLVQGLTRVIDADFPDPGILVDGKTIWAFATNSGGLNVPVRSSQDMVTWQAHADALPTRPSWAAQAGGFIWAPDVIKLGDNDYRMYVSARDDASQLMCIAVAKATQPEGPYTPFGAAPLTCGLQTAGTLDASPMKTADGRLFLVYKTNGDGDAAKYQLYLHQLASDGLSVIGNEFSLLKSTQGWEGLLLEGPNLAQRHNTFYLTYSCNKYYTNDYAIGLATASSVSGPYTTQPIPLLSTGLAGLLGPGGQTMFVGPDGINYMALHGWDSNAHSYRAMYVTPTAYLVQNANLPRSFNP